MQPFLEAIPYLIDAWSLILSPVVLGYLVLGVLLGLVIGVFPGLGGISGLSLILPFMFGLDPSIGLALMIGMLAVVPTSDTFASVLLGIPGSSASQATVLDGFPLARKGEAARALSAAFTSSLFGGLLGAAFLTFFILVARPIVLAFKSPELLMISVFGLSMVAILAGKVALKGLVAAGAGMLLASIGEGPFDGELRMASYDFPYLLEGFQLVIIALGIFALPEIIALLRQDQAIAERQALGAGWFNGIKDWWRNKWLSMRCALVGVIVGVIPGLGGSVVDWISYGHALMTTRDKSNFGKGEIRGVIAPESANNAKEGGGLVPTLLFGIPGSAAMAIFISALALLGSGELEVGQIMIKHNLNYTYAIVWMLGIANVVGTVLCILLSGQIAKITNIRFALIAPFIFMIIAFAAFQSQQDLLDLVALFTIAVIGIFMRRFSWPRPAFLIGFVLADPVENYTNNATQIAAIHFSDSFGAGIDYVATPLVIILALITVVSLVLGLRQARNMPIEGDAIGDGKLGPLLFLLALLAFIFYAFIDSVTIPDYAFVDAVFPLFVASVSLVGGLIMLAQMVVKPPDDLIFADRDKGPEAKGMQHGLWKTLAWFAGLLIATSLVGFILALAGFLLLFFHNRAGLSLIRSVLFSAAGLAFIVFMAWFLGRNFPPGLLQHFVDLPWPLR